MEQLANNLDGADHAIDEIHSIRNCSSQLQNRHPHTKDENPPLLLLLLLLLCCLEETY